MSLPIHHRGNAGRDDTVKSLAFEDLNIACKSPAPLLITDATHHRVESVARCIHDAGPRAQFPFVQTWARELPIDAERLKEHCLRVLEAGSGGSVLINAIEETPAKVQDALIDLLASLECARQPTASVRLMSGTTVLLVERISAGRFSERLFYRLNVIHLVAGESSWPEQPKAP